MALAKRIFAGLQGARREVTKAHERDQQQAAPAEQPTARPDPGTPEAAMWEYRDLIYAAGVSEADFDRAMEGRLIPFGAMGDDIKDFTARQNNRLYFDDERDARRDKMRKLVFGIQDKEARKKIIAKRAEADGLFAARRREDIEALRQTASQAQRRLASPDGWFGAAVTAGALVALGYGLFNVAGAIGGAVVGFFIGQGQVHSTRTRLAEAAQQAEENWREALKDDDENRIVPDFFSASEGRTGEEDAEFGNESAFATRIRMFHLKNQGNSESGS